MGRKSLNKHFKTCKRCGTDYISSQRNSKICPECHLPSGGDNGHETYGYNRFKKEHDL